MAADLLAQKLRLLERLDGQELFDALAAADERVVQLLGRQVALEQEVRQQQAVLAESEALAALAVEGKNDAERRARKVAALRADAAYQAAQAALRASEGELARVVQELEAAKRAARRLKRQIEHRTATLRFLGGD